jgi:transposase
MRYELADLEWSAIKPFLPNRPRGVPRVNDRRVLNGVFWVLRSGGHGATCLRRSRNQPMGRYRGGLTSKVHAVVDTNGLPVRLA